MRRVADRHFANAPSGDAPPLAARGVEVAYATGFSLAGIDLTVQAGELVAVLGPNGAGKTTLVKVLAGTLAPKAGEVLLFGRRIDEVDRREVARVLAVVAQDETPAFGWRVRDVVMMGRAPHQGAWLAATDEDRALVEDAMARCDLAALADRAVMTLSGGERKRVTIARALAQRPKVLLLDEPSAFLDVKHHVALYELLAAEVARSELACVVVMHDFATAAAYADRVALAKAGRLVAVGTVDEVLTTERLRDVFDAELTTGALADGRRWFLPARAAR